MIEIRPASPSDAARLSWLEASSVGDVHDPPFTYENILARGHFYPWSTTVMALEGEHLAGMVSLATKGVRHHGVNGTVGHIFGLRVAPAWRRQGVGRALLEAGEAALVGRGCVALYAYVGQANTASQALFNRHNFTARTAVAYVETLASQLPPEEGEGSEPSDEAERVALQLAAQAPFCPDDLQSRLYAASNPAYLGTYALAGLRASAGVWDKDAWLRRSKPHQAGLFCSACRFSSVAEWQALAGAILRRHPGKTKLTSIVSPAQAALAADTSLFRPLFRLNRIEEIVIKWLTLPGPPGPPGLMYLDIRD